MIIPLQNNFIEKLEEDDSETIFSISKMQEKIILNTSLDSDVKHQKS